MYIYIYIIRVDTTKKNTKACPNTSVEGNLATSKSKKKPFVTKKNTLPWNPLCPSWYRPWSLCSCLEDFLSKNVPKEPYLGFTWGTNTCALPFMAKVLSISPTSHFLSIPDFLWGNDSLLSTSKTFRLKSVTSCDESSAWQNLGLSVWGRFCLERKPTHPWGPGMPDTLKWTTAMAKQFLMYRWKQHSRKNMLSKKPRSHLEEHVFDVCVADLLHK